MILDIAITPKTELGPSHAALLYIQFTDKLDPRLRSIMLEVARWMMDRYHKKLVYTSVNRTQEENKKVGGSEYSAHLYGRALDVRIHNLTEIELNSMIEYINDHFQREEKWLYILVHGAGSNRHLHINIRYSHTHGSFA